MKLRIIKNHDNEYILQQRILFSWENVSSPKETIEQAKIASYIWIKAFEKKRKPIVIETWKC